MSPLPAQEALDILTAELDGHTGRIPPSLVAAQLIRVTEGGDFAFDERINGTRVVSNPRGYVGEWVEGFRPDFHLEVGA
jgi:hypothetical protein